MTIAQWKLDLIDCNATIIEYNYTDLIQLTSKSKVIVVCSICKKPNLKTTIASMRVRACQRAKGQIRYYPICKSCQQTRTWDENQEFKRKQSDSISKSMKKVWDDLEYRTNQSIKQSKISKKQWQNQEYRDKVVNGVTNAHKEINGYTEQAIKALKDSDEKRRINLAVKRRDLKYRQKLSKKSKLNWQDPEYRLKMLTIYADPEYRTKLSEKAKELWKLDTYTDKLLAWLTSSTCKEQLSSITKANWKNPDFKNKVLSALQTQQVHDKLSEHAKKLWSNADFATRMSKLAIERWQNPEYRAKMLAIYADPEYKAKASERAKELWKNPVYVKKVLENQKSKLEDHLANVLDDFEIQYKRQYHIGYWPFDFMIPSKPNNLLIEVHGDYWHGTKVDYNRSRDLAKATYIERYHNEYKLHIIWEHEFLTPQRIVDKLLTITGIVKPRIVNFNFKDCSIIITDAKMSNLLFTKYHYIASGGRSGVNIGINYQNKLIACARFCNSTRQESSKRLGLADTELLELTRFVIHPSYQKKNFASWILAKSVKLLRRKRPFIKALISFADTTYNHTGIIYRASNWDHDGIINPDYFYVDNDGYVMHKRTLWGHAQKMNMTERAYCSKYDYTKKWGKEKHRYIKWLN